MVSSITPWFHCRGGVLARSKKLDNPFQEYHTTFYLVKPNRFDAQTPTRPQKIDKLYNHYNNDWPKQPLDFKWTPPEHKTPPSFQINWIVDKKLAQKNQVHRITGVDHTRIF